jgi:hypothetical protein
MLPRGVQSWKFWPSPSEWMNWQLVPQHPDVAHSQPFEPVAGLPSQSLRPAVHVVALHIPPTQ